MNRTNMRGLRAALLFAATAAVGGAAMAQAPIYRCGDSYSQNPCPGGKIIAASDSRSPGQKAQTDEATRRDAKAASDMEKERLKAEARPAHAALPPPAAKSDAEAKPATKKSKAEKPFTAIAPKAIDEQKKKKAKKKKEKEKA